MTKEWLKRKRKVNTELIFKSLICGALTNIGISSCLNGFVSDISHVAMIKARQKLGDNVFKDINSILSGSIHERVFSIDGSKIRVHDGFRKLGYKTRTNDKKVRRTAKRPIAMLSSLYGVESLTTVNYTITKHFNERTCVPTLIENLQKDDIVVMDRGYYSVELFEHFFRNSIHANVRVEFENIITTEQATRDRSATTIQRFWIVSKFVIKSLPLHSMGITLSESNNYQVTLLSVLTTDLEKFELEIAYFAKNNTSTEKRM